MMTDDCLWLFVAAAVADTVVPIPILGPVWVGISKVMAIDTVINVGGIDADSGKANADCWLLMPIINV